MSPLDSQYDQYWRTRTINEAQLQGCSCLRLTCSCGRITDFPFPHSSAQRRQPGHLHRQHRLSLPEVRQHIAARRGQFSKERSRAPPTVTPVKQRPRHPLKEAGVWRQGCVGRVGLPHGGNKFEPSIIGLARQGHPKWKDAPCGLRPICGNQILFLNGRLLLMKLMPVSLVPSEFAWAITFGRCIASF